jgi:hypothetical protein
VYGNGESRIPCRVKWRYAADDWPLDDTVGRTSRTSTTPPGACATRRTQPI